MFCGLGNGCYTFDTSRPHIHYSRAKLVIKSIVTPIGHEPSNNHMAICSMRWKIVLHQFCLVAYKYLLCPRMHLENDHQPKDDSRHKTKHHTCMYRLTKQWTSSLSRICSYYRLSLQPLSRRPHYPSGQA